MNALNDHTDDIEHCCAAIAVNASDDALLDSDAVARVTDTITAALAAGKIPEDIARMAIITLLYNDE